jgi:uncharacterized protein
MNATIIGMPTHLTIHDALAHRVRTAVLASLPHAQAVWLFGSAAQGGLRSDSDLDIAVLLPQPLTALERFEYSETLARALGRDVDLIDFSRSTTVLQQQILTTGLRIACTDTARVDSYEAFCRSEYLHLNEQRGAQLRSVFARGAVLA